MSTANSSYNQIKHENCRSEPESALIKLYKASRSPWLVWEIIFYIHLAINITVIIEIIDVTEIIEK